MKEFSKLKVLAESPAPSTEERTRRKWFNDTDRLGADILDERISGRDGKGGSNLKAMLKSGGFPETEANDMIRKFNAFFDAYQEFKMAMLVEFDDTDD